MAMIRAGQIAAGIEALKSGLTIWEGSGGKCHSPYFKSVLAEGMALLGDVDGALRLLDHQIAQVERPGWEERLHYAEILRLKGGMLLLKHDPAGTEQYYLASLDWARQQHAKSWSCHVHKPRDTVAQPGRNQEAYALLAPIYRWFTEGFDTADLQEAKALLEALT